MIIRLDRLGINLPPPSEPDPAGASAVQELLGGKFGEMSTWLNYTFQSFNFRGRQKLRPFYDLIANIAAEEYGHIELVSYAINLLKPKTVIPMHFGTFPLLTGKPSELHKLVPGVEIIEMKPGATVS